VVDNFFDAGLALLKTSGEKKTSGPHPNWLASAIAEYSSNILQHDPPMLAAQKRLGSHE
jgi:hypothetical protein